MPLGLLRLNERSQRPSDHINFIKPLTTSSPQDQKIAQDFLERIAAQCYPVMKVSVLPNSLALNHDVSNASIVC